MKILFCPSDNNLAGAFQSMAKLCSILKKEYDFEILVVLRKKGIGQQLLDENEIPYIFIPTVNWIIPDHPKSFFRRLEYIVRVITKPIAIFCNIIAEKIYQKTIINEKIDIVHLNTSYIYVPAQAAIKCDVPVIWHLREFLEEDQSKRIWNRKKGYQLINKANKIVTISNSLFDKYKNIFDDSKLVKIYNGIDDKQYAALDHVILNEEKIKILMVGTINKSKGQIQAIKACEVLVNRGFSNFELTIVGGMSKYANCLKEIVDKKNLKKYIKFAGLQKNTSKFYKSSDVVLVCSKYEAFGRVTVEAMMAGCLVIGANSGGTIELIEDGSTGVLFESGDYVDLVNKMIYVIENKNNAKKIAKNGRNVALQCFTALINASNIMNLYLDIKK